MSSGNSYEGKAHCAMKIQARTCSAYLAFIIFRSTLLFFFLLATTQLFSRSTRRVRIGRRSNTTRSFTSKFLPSHVFCLQKTAFLDLLNHIHSLLTFPWMIYLRLSTSQCCLLVQNTFDTLFCS